MIIDPKNKEFIDTPLWCIYGPECFPVIFCCKISDTVHETPSPVIWGYSVYKEIPGFRTLGRHLTEWIEEVKNLFGTEPIFFNRQDEALTYLGKLTNPLGGK